MKTIVQNKYDSPDVLAFKGIDKVLDRTYPFSETPEVLRYLEKGHARGKVVITIS